LEYSVDVPYTLFFVTHSNTKSMFFETMWTSATYFLALS
jgi:hypothetical protein